MATPSIASLLHEIGRPSHFENSGGLNGVTSGIDLESVRASVAKHVRRKKVAPEPEMVNAKFDPDQALKELGVTPGFLNDTDKKMLDEMLSGLQTNPQPVEPEVQEAIGKLLASKRTKNRFRAAPESRLNELAVASNKYLTKAQRDAASYFLKKQGSR